MRGRAPPPLLGGHLQVLTWAREHDWLDCPWFPHKMYALAAQGGHLEVLQWARQHDCPWDALTCT